MARKPTSKARRRSVPLDAERKDSGAHPFAAYLQELIRLYDLKHADLVKPDRLLDLGLSPDHALSVDQSHVARLLKLRETDRPSLGLLSQLFRLFTDLAEAKAREAHTPRGVAIADVLESWGDFLSRRGESVFYELARRLAAVKDPPNPTLSLITRDDEVDWQRSHIPQERWVITDTLAEDLYDDFLEATCALVQQEKLGRLIYFLPDTDKAREQFDRFHTHATHAHLTEDILAKKVRCLLLQDYVPIVRMRLDDPAVSKSRLRSGVLSIGSAVAPLGFVLTQEAIGSVIEWLHPKVRAMERSLSGKATAPNGEEAMVYYPRS